MNYKEEFTKCINDIKNPKTIYKQIPNLLTASRAIGIIPINILYFIGNIKAALITCFLVFITDFFDGKIARKYNLTSDFGSKLDALCDKIMFFGLSLPLLVNLPIIIPSLILEFLIGMTNIIKYHQGYEVKTNFAGKVKTWLLSISLILGYASLYINYPSIILNLSIASTILSESITLGKYLTNNQKVSEISNNLNQEIPTIEASSNTKENDLPYKYTYSDNLELTETKSHSDDYLTKPKKLIKQNTPKK